DLPPLPQGGVAVVLFQAAGLAEAAGDHPRLVLAADLLAALHADPGVRQRLDSLRRDRDAAALAEPRLRAHPSSSAADTSWPLFCAGQGGASFSRRPGMCRRKPPVRAAAAASGR